MTYQEGAIEGFLEPTASTGEDELVEFPTSIAADNFNVGQITTLKQPRK